MVPDDLHRTAFYLLRVGSQQGEGAVLAGIGREYGEQGVDIATVPTRVARTSADVTSTMVQVAVTRR